MYCGMIDGGGCMPCGMYCGAPCIGGGGSIPCGGGVKPTPPCGGINGLCIAVDGGAGGSQQQLLLVLVFEYGEISRLNS